METIIKIVIEQEKMKEEIKNLKEENGKSRMLINIMNNFLQDLVYHPDLLNDEKVREKYKEKLYIH